MSLDWREPPPKRRAAGRPGIVDYSQLAEALKKKPGKWVMAKAYSAPKANGSWGNYMKLRLEALLGAKNVEVRSAFKDGRGEVFARYRREDR